MKIQMYPEKFEELLREGLTCEMYEEIGYYVGQRVTIEEVDLFKRDGANHVPTGRVIHVIVKTADLVPAQMCVEFQKVDE